MNLELIICVGIMLSYLNFVTHESSLFEQFRNRYVIWMQSRRAAEKIGADLLFGLWKCHLCHNFWLSLLISFIAGFPLYICLTSPIIAFIIKNKCLNPT
jgi:hypothetical protein